MQSGCDPALLCTAGILVIRLDEEEIIGFEALWDSMMKCKRGVMWKDSVANFVLNGVPEVARLSDELENNTYKERSHKYFSIRYPKERKIMSIAFRDRVYQRSLNDIAIYPMMSKSFIYDNCACQKGKGTKDFIDIMLAQIREYARKHGYEGYVLQLDIKKFFPSTDHDIVIKCISEYVDEKTAKACADVIRSFAEIEFAC